MKPGRGVVAIAGVWLSLLSLAVGALTPAQDVRYQTLINQLRCLVCQNQTIADSSAPLAADLRKQVYTQIAAGRSDAEIKRYLTDRYGDFVLYKPPFKRSTWLLWLAPFAVLLLALAAALRFARRGTARQVAPVDAAALSNLLKEEARLARPDRERNSP